MATLCRQGLGCVEFDEYLAALKPLAVIYPTVEALELSEAEMVDQCSLVKELFGGRWPSRG